MKKICLVVMGLLLTVLIQNNSRADGFEACHGSAKIKKLSDTTCAIINVPQNHNSSTSEKSVSLFVRKFPALKQSKGSVWLIAGGPGDTGAVFYNMIDRFRKAFADYDVLVPDHRGTGLSSPICPGQAIDSIAGSTLVGEEWGQCFNHMYADIERATSFSVTNAAKDLRQLINQLSSEGNTYLYGVSYGTQLTLRTMQLKKCKG